MKVVHSVLTEAHDKALQALQATAKEARDAHLEQTEIERAEAATHGAKVDQLVTKGQAIVDGITNEALLMLGGKLDLNVNEFKERVQWWNKWLADNPKASKRQKLRAYESKFPTSKKANKTHESN